MIEITNEDIFCLNVDAIVIPVNTVGVMGKGLAKDIKEKYPYVFSIYLEALKNKDLDIGKLFCLRLREIYTEYHNFIIFFPTKTHYRYPSKIDYIQKGLDDIVNIINKFNIKSIAIPAIGCGLGGLKWSQVQALIYSKLDQLLFSRNIEIYLIPPKSS